jgi:hypothetical protein
MYRLIALVFLVFVAVNGQQCPPIGKELCPKIYNPVTCPDGCVYSNYCLAKSAGYKEKCVPNASNRGKGKKVGQCYRRIKGKKERLVSS